MNHRPEGKFLKSPKLERRRSIYALSVAAIIITGVVLIQGYRDTAAIHAKLDEIIVALRQARNEVVGLEHEDPKDIVESLTEIEKRAKQDVG